MSENWDKKPDKQSRSPASALKEAFGNPGFVACIIILMIFTLGFKIMAAHKKIQFKKLPVHLKKPLDQLDRSKLAPYEFISHVEITSEVLNELGTEDYIQWGFRDSSSKTLNKPEDILQLFITYYTDKPGQVPHVPEACYLGGGYQLEGDSIIQVPIPALGEDFKIPVKVVLFRRSGLLGQSDRIVMYTFNANGQFCAGRREVMLVIGDTRTKYAYFSKLEISFGNKNNTPEKEEAIKAGKRFFQILVPVLVKEHWPDWNALVSQTESNTSNSKKMDNKTTETNILQ